MATRIVFSNGQELSPRTRTASSAPPFCGVYRLAAGLIVMARHYLSDADTVERILGGGARRT